MAMRCFWPPDICTPRSPTAVSYLQQQQPLAACPQAQNTTHPGQNAYSGLWASAEAKVAESLCTGRADKIAMQEAKDVLQQSPAGSTNTNKYKLLKLGIL